MQTTLSNQLMKNRQIIENNKGGVIIDEINFNDTNIPVGKKITQSL